MNPLSHILAVIDAFEGNQIPFFAMVSKLGVEIESMPDSYEEKNDIYENWWVLEQVNAVMLDRGVSSFSPENTLLVQNTVDEIKQILAKITKVMVSLVDDSTALYVYGKRKMKISIEQLPDGVILDADTIKSWLPPYQDEMVSGTEKEYIQRLISEYFDKNNIVYGWI